jgi:hypothetical protein
MSATPDAGRAERACTDVVAVEDLAPGMARVTTIGGSYTVDARDGGCLCKDKEYNEPTRCKHEQAAVLAGIFEERDLQPPFITEDLE